MARNRDLESESPTLPLPPPRISLEDFIEAAAGAALRAARAQAIASPDNPEPSPWRRPIWCGIIFDPWAGRESQVLVAGDNVGVEVKAEG